MIDNYQPWFISGIPFMTDFPSMYNNFDNNFLKGMFLPAKKK